MICPFVCTYKFTHACMYMHKCMICTMYMYTHMHVYVYMHPIHHQFMHKFFVYLYVCTCALVRMCAYLFL